MEKVMVLNRYPWWKNVIIVLIVLVGFIYAAPNLYGEDPAVQISPGTANAKVDTSGMNAVGRMLDDAQIIYKKLMLENDSIIVLFTSTDEQLKAKEFIQQNVGDNFLVALTLSPAAPMWLRNLGAMPMKLGLDLRGGVHFLLQVDVESVLKQRVDGDMHNISQLLRQQHIRYTSLNRDKKNNINIIFRDQPSLDDAYHILSQQYVEFAWKKSIEPGVFGVDGMLDAASLQRMHQDTLEQAMNTLRNRVNELGVSEAVVQQQGASRVAIDLPGVLNATEAKNILGKTATLEFHMVDTDHDANIAVGGTAPPDTHLYMYDNNHPILLKNEIILRGSSITSASSGMGDDGRASVDVRLGGGGEALFTKTTAENIGKPMAVLYVEVKSASKNEDGKNVIDYQTDRKVISVATIQSALGNSFQITGLSSQNEARTLALLLRAGALPAPVTIIEEREVGPRLGKQNIHMGILSVIAGLGLVVIFMALYYRTLGYVANLALAMNLVLIVAILSLLGATLTLPGIAGMVLTVGMAVDANVLIFERIREELRNGIPVQASIHAGYERAFATIVDANVTTLIVAIVLFSLGSGAVKGFAVTLTIGILTSMFTSTIGTRAVVNALYGNKPVKTISIGM
jgi:preprotein translocase subunit SecD